MLASIKSIVALMGMSLIASIGHSQTTLQHLLEYGPPPNISSPMAATVTFQQVTNTSEGTDASYVSKITFNYFTSTNCSGFTEGTYTTPNGTSFPINTSTTFYLNAKSTYDIGAALGLNMLNINSVAVFLKSTNNNTPQADFTGSCGSNPSFCCIQLDCSSGTQCTAASAIGTQNFQLKTTAAIGDPADGGLIACMNASSNLYLVVPASDNSSAIQWSSNYLLTGATSNVDGSSNTTTIVNALGAGTYAARLCYTYTTTGGFMTGWFLPAGLNYTNSGQLNCIRDNRAKLNMTDAGTYWSSTEDGEFTAWRQNFDSGGSANPFKTDTLKVRCARTFTP